MHIPSHLMRQGITITRRVDTGLGHTDTTVGTGIQAKIESVHRTVQNGTGTIGQIVTILYMLPTDIAVGDRLVLPNQTILETRSVSTVFAANGTTAAMLKVEAW